MFAGTGYWDPCFLVREFSILGLEEHVPTIKQMRRFLINQAKGLVDQSRRQHHKSPSFLSPQSRPLASLSRFFSSTSEMSASDSTSSLPVTLDSINPKVGFLFSSSLNCGFLALLFFPRLIWIGF